MFIRTKLITNSSSTSFIAWGCIVKADLVKTDDFWEKVDSFLDTTNHKTIEVISGETTESSIFTDFYIVYLKESYIGIDEYTTELIEDLSKDKIKKFKKILNDMLQQVGVTEKDELKFGWIFSSKGSY